jgi:cytochrome b6-f complex iron-sulfur subunit
VIRMPATDLISRSKRRHLLRLGFLGFAGLATTELAAAFAPFFRVTRSAAGFGATVTVPSPKSSIIERFAETDDEPILYAQWKFFLIRAPGGIAAAYRKCTHLGCAVPFNKAEDRFHCGCHGSIYDKRTAVVIRDPAPRPLDLFHIREEGGALVVDTNPLNVIVRDDNKWHDDQLEVRI